jgi:hypothetical protein
MLDQRKPKLFPVENAKFLDTVTKPAIGVIIWKIIGKETVIQTHCLPVI